MTKTGIVEPEMSLRIRRSFSLGSRLRRIRLAPMRRRGRLPSLWTAALSESGYIFAKASADAPTQIGACRRGSPPGDRERELGKHLTVQISDEESAGKRLDAIRLESSAQLDRIFVIFAELTVVAGSAENFR
jgi:hypothetical protein